MEKSRLMAVRLSGRWRRRLPADHRRRFWQRQNRPNWCHFIPALTVAFWEASPVASGGSSATRRKVHPDYSRDVAAMSILFITHCLLKSGPPQPAVGELRP